MFKKLFHKRSNKKGREEKVNIELREKIMTDAQALIEILDMINEGVAFISRDREILYWNKGAEKLTGFQAEDMVGKICSDDLLDFVDKSGKHYCGKDCPLIRAIAERKTFEARVYIKTTFEKRMPVDVKVVPLIVKGQLLGGVEIFTDATIAEILESELSLEPLTRFPLWSKIETQLDYEDERIRRYGIPFSVITVILDRIQEGAGEHEESVETRILDALGDHLRRHVRKADMLCRYDSNNFVVLMPHTHKIGALQLAERLRSSVEQASPTVTISLCVAERKKEESVYETIKRSFDTLLHMKPEEKNKIQAAE